eukprot:1816938-Amphidinium_carterae.1
MIRFKPDLVQHAYVRPTALLGKGCNVSEEGFTSGLGALTCEIVHLKPTCFHVSLRTSVSLNPTTGRLHTIGLDLLLPLGQIFYWSLLSLQHQCRTAFVQSCSSSSSESSSLFWVRVASNGGETFFLVAVMGLATRLQIATAQ